MHDLPLITTIAVGFVAAWVLGLLTQRLGFSSIVGYWTAGRRGRAADEPVRLMFLAVTPEDEPRTQLALLAQISQLVANPKTRERLLQAEAAGHVVEIL